MTLSQAAHANILKGTMRLLQNVKSGLQSLDQHVTMLDTNFKDFCGATVLGMLESRKMT